jgi:hypothetical protein
MPASTNRTDRTLGMPHRRNVAPPCGTQVQPRRVSGITAGIETAPEEPGGQEVPGSNPGSPTTESRPGGTFVRALRGRTICPLVSPRHRELWRSPAKDIGAIVTWDLMRTYALHYPGTDESDGQCPARGAVSSITWSQSAKDQSGIRHWSDPECPRPSLRHSSRTIGEGISLDPLSRIPLVWPANAATHPGSRRRHRVLRSRRDLMACRGHGSRGSPAPRSTFGRHIMAIPRP